LAVITFRLMTCAKTPITVLSPVAPLNISVHMPSYTLYAEPTADVVKGDQSL
jgi:hypothetical protein